MSEINMGTLYDFNKSIMQNEPVLSRIKLKDCLRQVKDFFNNNKTYYMLLCHDLRDYTIFKYESESSSLAVKELLEVLEERGSILAIDKKDNAFEIWIRNAEGAFCYYLFPYDEAIVEC